MWYESITLCPTPDILTTPSGGSTILVGVLFMFVMPVDTTTAWFLNEPERRIATERLALDRETRDRSEFNMAQVKEAVLDPGSWLYFLMAFFICLPSPILKVTEHSPLQIWYIESWLIYQYSSRP